MFKAFFLIFFYSMSVLAIEDADVCLGVKKLGPDKLSFYTREFYTREEDKPYFYAKVVTEESDGKVVTLEVLKNMPGHLLYLPPANPREYQVPEKAKKLYVVKSKTSIKDFDLSAQIVPTMRKEERDVIDLSVKKRNASNDPHPVPRETINNPRPTIRETTNNPRPTTPETTATKKRGGGDTDAVKICEFEFFIHDKK
jgi:hypothetical protein